MKQIQVHTAEAERKTASPHANISTKSFSAYFWYLEYVTEHILKI